MKNRKELLEELSLLEEADLIDMFGGSDVLLEHTQDPFKPIKKPVLYWNSALKEFGFKKPATEEKICSVLQPLGARLIFITPADDCDPLTKDQES